MGWQEARGVRLELKRTRRLAATHRVILYALADAAGKDRQSWPSLATLMKWTWLGKTALCRALSVLEDEGLITREKRADGEGRNMSTVYGYAGPVCIVREADTGVRQEDNGVREADSGVVPLANNGVREADTKGSKKESVDKGPKKEERGEVAAVLQFWSETMGKGVRGTKTATAIGKQRVRLIKGRLKDGYSVDEMKKAITACASSEFHMKGGHNDLTLILRPEKLERFLGTTQARSDHGHIPQQLHEADWEYEQRVSGHSKKWTPDPEQEHINGLDWFLGLTDEEGGG